MLKGHGWLNAFANAARRHGLAFVVTADDVASFTNPATGHRVDFDLKSVDADETKANIQFMFRQGFENFYSSEMWEPVEDDDEDDGWEHVESLASRTVDNLLSETDEPDPKASVGDFMKSYATAHPIGPHPAEADVDQDRMLRGVKVIGKYYLFLWDTYRRGEHGHNYLGYRFVDPKGVILFQGTEYGCPFNQCVDSDETVKELLKWFTIKPGDTDDEYFENYTPEQMAFATSDDAEQLALDLEYGHGEGNVEGYSKPWVDLPGYEHDDPEE